MLVPTHPALLANSGFEDRSGGYAYSPPRMTSHTLGSTGAETTGGRRPSIHMRRRRCSATPVLTGRASSIPSPHSPAFRGSPLHTPRRASTPLPANTHMTTRNTRSSASFAFSSLHPQRPSQGQGLTGTQDLSARVNVGSRDPSPDGQGRSGAPGGLGGSNQANSLFSTENGDPGHGAVPGLSRLGGLPNVMADPRAPHKADLTNGMGGTRPPLQPQQGGIDPSSPYHLSPLMIPTPQLSTFPARSNSPAGSPCTPATAIYRPAGLGSALGGRGASLSVQSHSGLSTLRSPPNGPAISDRDARDVKPNHILAPTTLPRLPGLPISINGVNGNAGRPSSNSSARIGSAHTSSLSVDTEHSRLLYGARAGLHDTTHDRILHPTTPLTARPLPHSERTPTMSHGDKTPIAPIGQGSHIPMILDCPPMGPIDELHKQAPLNWCNPRTSDLVLGEF